MKRIIIGLTGPTGSGKSSAARAVRKMGVQVVDCDITARRATTRGSRGLELLRGEFGDGIIDSDGSLNRKKLAGIAFSDSENTERLNKTLLPIIAELIKREIVSDKVLLDAPTLFESGIDSICDDTVAVLSDTSIRRKRIIARDNLTIEEANARISAGKSDDFYIKRAGHILFNDDDFDAYMSKAKKIFENLFGGNINV